MKTKRSMKDRECHLCKGKIAKGDQYALKQITDGKMATWNHDGPIPDWAWEPYRFKVAVCDPCANPKGGEKDK
mgnify:CR=1 FL=1|jgi:hypothetical protein